MGTKQYDSATDLITFSRSSGGTALRKVSYGNELVTNGDFATNVNGWTALFGSISWESGKLHLIEDGVDGNTARAYQGVTTEIGKVYRITVDVGAVSLGNASVAASTNTNTGGFPVVSSSGNETVELVFVAAATTTNVILFAAGSSARTADFDNVSVKEATFDQAGGTLELFNHPDDVPRIEYNADGTVKGLLIEENRVNLITYSAASVANWYNASALSRTDSNENALGVFDGVIVAGNGSDWQGTNSPSFTTTNGVAYSVTAWIKKGTSPNFSVRLRDNTAASETRVEGAWGSSSLTTVENAGAISNRSITYITDTLAVVSFTVARNSTSTNTYIRIGPYSLTSGETIVALGAQAEVGGFPTSYIPTAGASRTRSSDVASIPTSAFGYNDEAGTVVCDFSMSFDGTNYPRVWEVGSTINNQDRINLYGHAPQDKIGCGFLTANVAQAGFTLSTNNTVPTAQTKAAFAWEENNVAAVQDGNTVQQDSVATLKGGNPRTSLGLGYTTTSSSDVMNGHIKSIQYYPRRLTNAQLQELTT